MPYVQVSSLIAGLRAVGCKLLARLSSARWAGIFLLGMFDPGLLLSQELPAPQFTSVVQEDPAPLGVEGQQRAEFILATAWEPASRVNSWQFSAVVNGEEDLKSAETGELTLVRKELARFTHVFDRQQARMRCDGFRNVNIESRMSITPEGTLLWDANNNVVQRSPDSRLPKGGRQLLWMIDPRSVSWSDPQQQLSLSDPYGVIKNERFAAKDVVFLADSDEQLIEIRWFFGGIALVSVFFDKTNAYLPVFAGLRMKEADVASWRFVEFSSVRTVWGVCDDVPVPVHVEARRLGVKRRNSSIDFTWAQVNQPIPDDMFSLAGMEVSVGTKVLDHTQGRPLFIGDVDENGDVRDINAGLLSVHRPRPIGRAYLYVNAAVLAVAVTLFFRRGKARALVQSSRSTIYIVLTMAATSFSIGSASEFAHPDTTTPQRSCQS